MSITRAAIEKNRITSVLLMLIIVAGSIAFFNLPQTEDPGFILRIAAVTTVLPGASPERIEDLITDPVESAVQQIPELRFVTSESQTGLSIVYVEIAESEKVMQPIWDNLRRKVEAIRGELPSGTIGPFVNDEFADVFGIIYSVTGEGYTYAELKDVADQVRDEFLRIPDVAKVEIYGAQEERIFVEYNNARLAQLGLSPRQLTGILESQNILFPGGNISTGQERITLEPTGNFENLEELKRTVISVPGRNELLYLEDIASVERGYVDPPSSLLRSTGERSLGIGVSMSDGGNVITLGEDIRRVVNRLQGVYPIGIEFDELYFQPEVVEESVNDFVRNLLQAVAIVVIVMLLFLGLRTGMIVVTLIPMTILLSMIVMDVMSITINIISLAALIIALGMLVDNAIVMSESILVLMKEGKSAKDAAIESAKELRIPLLTSSLTTAAAFMPIALAESSTGEYTVDLFRVVTIALLSSWLLSLTMIPLLSVLVMKVKKNSKSEGTSYDSKFYKGYRAFLLNILNKRWISIGVVVLVFIGSMQLSAFIPALFFPASDRSFIRAFLEFPVGTPIEVTDSMVRDLEAFMSENFLVNEDRPEGILNWSSFIGVGSPRYTLSADVQPEKEEYAKLLINTTSRPAADIIITQMEEYLWERYPDLDIKVLPLDLGPPVMAPFQLRLSGEDADELFTIVDSVKAELAQIPGTKNIADNWGARVKKLIVDVDQPRARMAGVSSMDIALSLQTSLVGLTASEFRENEDVIPVVLRAEAADRNDLQKLETLDVFSQSSGQTVPLKQVADLNVVWEPSKILRRDRQKTVTISCYTADGVYAMDIVKAIQPWMEVQAQSWPIGYMYEYGGEMEESVESQKAIMAKLPLALMVIILLLVAQFNSLRRPLIILITIPLAMIGVNVGLVVMNGVMGFMTFLGIIALIGIVINNAIVLLDRIKFEIEENGLEPHHAVIEASQRRLRPILMTTATTIGGMIPLYLGGGPMWESLAIAIMSGLIFSTMLTLGVVPILYSMFFRLKFNKTQVGELKQLMG
jgi:multidrug efflux pump